MKRVLSWSHFTGEEAEAERTPAPRPRSQAGWSQSWNSNQKCGCWNIVMMKKKGKCGNQLGSLGKSNATERQPYFTKDIVGQQEIPQVAAEGKRYIRIIYILR